MSSAYRQLKEQFKSLGSKLSPETRETSKRYLQEWLASNASELEKKKVGAEFNGTMMQWFHWT
jgi:alpha-amylase